MSTKIKKEHFWLVLNFSHWICLSTICRNRW